MKKDKDKENIAVEPKLANNPIMDIVGKKRDRGNSIEESQPKKKLKKQNKETESLNQASTTENSAITQDKLHNSQRKLILEEEYKKAIEEQIKEYKQILPTWLKGSLQGTDIIESIVTGINSDENKADQRQQMKSVVASIEAVMQLIEDNSKIYCLNNEESLATNKDDMLTYLLDGVSYAIDKEVNDYIMNDFSEIYKDTA